MAKRSADDKEEPEITGDEQITCNTILDHALEGTDLPKRESRPLGEWLALFTDPELVRCLGELVRACRVTDVGAARGWAHQAEDAYLRIAPRGKDPAHT